MYFVFLYLRGGNWIEPLLALWQQQLGRVYIFSLKGFKQGAPPFHPHNFWLLVLLLLYFYVFKIQIQDMTHFKIEVRSLFKGVSKILTACRISKINFSFYHGTTLDRSYLLKMLSNLRFSFSSFCVFWRFQHRAPDVALLNH